MNLLGQDYNEEKEENKDKLEVKIPKKIKKIAIVSTEKNHSKKVLEYTTVLKNVGYHVIFLLKKTRPNKSSKISEKEFR